MIVIDASVLANVLADDSSEGQRARERVKAADGLAAPDLVDAETMAVLRKRWLGGTLTAERLSEAIDDLTDLDMDRYPALPFARRAFELRQNVTVYDATYVALAELLGCELVTADERLASAPGLRCAIEVLR